MKFTVHNPNGTIEACPGDYPTLQAFVNEKFGSAFEAFQERGGLVLGADPVGADPVVADPVVADPV